MNTAHSEERNFECTQCEYKAKTSFLLKKHVKHVHNKEPYKSYWNMKKYKGKYDATTTCDKCGKVYHSNHTLKQHYLQEHPTSEEISQISANCHNCDKICENANSLNNHLVTCTKDLKEFQCDKCETIWHSG